MNLSFSHYFLISLGGSTLVAAQTSNRNALASGSDCQYSFEESRRHVIREIADSFTIDVCEGGCNAFYWYCCANGLCAESPYECGVAPQFGGDPDSFSMEQTAATRSALMMMDGRGIAALVADDKLEEWTTLAAGELQIKGEFEIPFGLYAIQVAKKQGSSDAAAKIIDANGDTIASFDGKMFQKSDSGAAEKGKWIIRITPCCITVWDTDSPFPTNNFEFCWCI